MSEDAPDDATELAPVPGAPTPVSFFVDPQFDYLLEEAPPLPGTQVMPEWFTTTPPHYHRTLKYQVLPPELKLRENATVRSCPGIVDYLSGGYILRLWADFAITFVDGQYAWESHQQEFRLGQHDPGQYQKMPKPGFPLVLKFFSPWYCRTPPGYSVRVFPLFYHYDQLWEALPGVIHTDVFHETHLNVQIAFKKGQLILPRGLPMARIVPFRRERYDLDVRAGTPEELESIKAKSRKRGRYFHDPHSYPRAKGTM